MEGHKEERESSKKIREEMNESEDKENSASKQSLTDKFRENPWVLSTFVLGVIVLILLVGKLGITGGVISEGNIVSEDEAGKIILDLAKEQIGDAELIGVEPKNGLYEVTIKMQGNDVPVYITLDGKNLIAGGLTPIADIKSQNPSSQDSQPVEVPKTDKPVVELYVFTYCPYGTQSEKGIIPVAKLLGNKINFKIRQIGAMHGEYEKIEAERQLCIEKEYPAKFLDYVNSFALNSKIGDCRGDAICVGPKIDDLYDTLGINKAKIDTCMKDNGESLYSAEEKNSRAKGVSGSPTLIINGQKVQSGRDSASYLSVICDAFNNPPKECEKELSSASPSPGFGGSTSSGSNSVAQCN